MSTGSDDNNNRALDHVDRVFEEEHQAQERTRLWVEEAVIGLNLCPFASAPMRKGIVYITVSHAKTWEEAVHDALAEAEALLGMPAEERSTTLIVYPNALQKLDDLLDASEEVADLLAEADADWLLQVATFHPSYRFAHEPEGDPSHYTNRAPYPTLHLIREDEVEEAALRHPDIEGIPEVNITLMRSMGLERLRAMWRRWTVTETSAE